MVNYSGLLAAALVAGAALATTATVADAKHRRGCNCGPTTSKHVKTVHPASSVTRYHDVSKVVHVPRIHRVVNITRVQPIIRIHDVTRVHHHTIYYPKYTYSNVVQRLPPIREVTHSVVHSYDCRCGY